MLSQAEADADESALHEARHLPQASISAAAVALESDDGCVHSITAQVERNVCACLCHALPSRQSAKCIDDAAAVVAERDERGIEWHWDRELKSDYANISESGSEVHFHADFSSGTSVVRGTKPFTKGQHYWEIKMTSSVYGTDMMVGFGTDAAELNAYANVFVSFLGLTSETWGLSYFGQVWHHGVSRTVGRRFEEDSVVGVHLDMWHGQASLFIDGQPIGTAFTTGLRGKKLYPMVCSTAAQTSMRIVRACSAPDSLQFACCQALRRLVPAELKVTDALPLPPGLRHVLDNNVDWLVRPCRPSGASMSDVLDRSTGESPTESASAAISSSSSLSPSQQLLQQRHQSRPYRAAGLLQPSASAVAASRKRCMRRHACGIGSGLLSPLPPQPPGAAMMAGGPQRCGNGWKRLKGESDDPNGSDDKDSSDDEEADNDAGCAPRTTQEDDDASSSSSSTSSSKECEPEVEVANRKEGSDFSSH